VLPDPTLWLALFQSLQLLFVFLLVLQNMFDGLIE
jgi:hypothetical protein